MISLSPELLLLIATPQAHNTAAQNTAAHVTPAAAAAAGLDSNSASDILIYVHLDWQGQAPNWETPMHAPVILHVRSVTSAAHTSFMGGVCTAPGAALLQASGGLLYKVACGATDTVSISDTDGMPRRVGALPEACSILLVPTPEVRSSVCSDF